MDARQRGDGHAVFQLETVSAGFVDGQLAVDGQGEMVISIHQLRLPSTIAVLEPEFVALGAEWPLVSIKHRKDHRQVVWSIRRIK